jgi:hypothetical protein
MNHEGQRWVVASLTERRWLYRALEVTTSEGTFRVAYNGRGIGYESVSVNGACAVRQRSKLTATYVVAPEIRFFVGSRPAVVKVSAWPWLAIRAFSLEVDRQEVYAEA